MLSLWRENVCAGSFRLAVDEVPDLIDALRAGLDAAYRHAPTRPQRRGPGAARLTRPARPPDASRHAVRTVYGER